jgi:hypothetical protein
MDGGESLDRLIAYIVLDEGIYRLLCLFPPVTSGRRLYKTSQSTRWLGCK